MLKASLFREKVGGVSMSIQGTYSQTPYYGNYGTQTIPTTPTKGIQNRKVLARPRKESTNPLLLWGLL